MPYPLSELPAPRELIERLKSPEGQKLVRYSVASLVAVAVSEVCLVIFNGVVGMSAWVSSSLATAIAAVPNYYMNRKWAWGKHGRSHLFKEVVPFWSLAFLGWALSTYSVYLTERIAKHHHLAHLWTTIAVAVVYIAAFGVLWVGKFIIFNKMMFVHRHQAHQPAGSQGDTFPPVATVAKPLTGHAPPTGPRSSERAPAGVQLPS